MPCMGVVTSHTLQEPARRTEELQKLTEIPFSEAVRMLCDSFTGSSSNVSGVTAAVFCVGLGEKEFSYCHAIHMDGV